VLKVSPCLLCPSATLAAGHSAKIQRSSQPTASKPVVGKATIYTGPFTVHSYPHAFKYQLGCFQFSFFSDEAPSDEDVNHLPRLGDETYKFEFINDRPDRY
jgi:hypothetical protein